LISSDGSTLALSKISGGPALLKVGPDLGLSLLPASQDLPEGRIGDNLPNGRIGSIDRAGKRLSYNTDAGVSVWDLSPLRRVADLAGDHGSYRDQSQVSPDGRWLVSIVEDRAVIVRDLAQAPSGTATPALDASCSLKQDECIRRLCAKVAASIDETLLNDLLSSSDLQDMKGRLSATCSAGGS
jgi:WD40 repeat protein